MVKAEKMQKLRVERDPEAGPSRAERRQEWLKEKLGGKSGVEVARDAGVSRAEKRAQKKAAKAAAGQDGVPVPAGQQQQQQKEGGADAMEVEHAQPGTTAAAAPAGGGSAAAVNEVMVGMVVVFGVEGPKPLFTCIVPGSSPQCISFVPLDTPLGAVAAAGGLPPGLSPLLVMTQDRRYALPSGKLSGAAAAVAGSKAAAVAGATGSLEDQQQQQGLEALYGKGLGVQGSQRGAGGGQAKVDFKARQAALQQLLDTPSHVLPPPSALVPTMLQLLIKADLA
jgi:NET1-associated nuclear protein 1 (U3 small nucleolar RNA-associated protein 17)